MPALLLVAGASTFFVHASNTLALAAPVNGHGCAPAEFLGLFLPLSHTHEQHPATPPQAKKASAPTPSYIIFCDNEGLSTVPRRFFCQLPTPARKSDSGFCDMPADMWELFHSTAAKIFVVWITNQYEKF